VRPDLRDREHHDFWSGLVAVLIGVVLLVSGATHLTGIETLEGSAAREVQLVKAFAKGGLEWYEPPPIIVPNPEQDPAGAAAAYAQMERAQVQPARGKYRVNTGAVDPCPT
jgi:hypothetical protein